MKQLQEIVKEELQKFTGEMGAEPAEISAQGMKNKALAAARLEQDPALRALIKPFIDTLWMVMHAPLPPGSAHNLIEIVLAEQVIVWERANEAFNNQLTPRS